MFLFLSCATILCMSSTDTGSTPAKGSSNRMKFGSVARALAISVRRRSYLVSGKPGKSDGVSCKFHSTGLMIASCGFRLFTKLVGSRMIERVQKSNYSSLISSLRVLYATINKAIMVSVRALIFFCTTKMLQLMELLFEFFGSDEIAFFMT